MIHGIITVHVGLWSGRAYRLFILLSCFHHVEGFYLL
jgi:hypothetical protein